MRSIQRARHSAAAADSAARRALPDARARLDEQGLDFLRRFGRAPVRGLPKYAQLREAIVAAIEQGHWAAGDRLPTESEFVRTTPLSLGTVQRALRSLVDEGIVTRVQGSGTFVATGRQQMEAPWHCRFLDADETSILPVYPKLVSRKRIAARGRWSPYLGRDPVIQIDRRLGIGNEFFVYSRLYMSASRFGALLTKPTEEIEARNFKAMIGNDFHVPIVQIGQRVSFTRFDARVCRATRVASGTLGLLMECIAVARAGFTVYYQELYIPPNERRLVASDSDAAWESALS